MFAAEPRDLSLLHALFYFNSGGGIINLTSTAGGAQDSRFVGGSQLVSIRMAARLGRRVVLKAPVRRIASGRGGVTVDSDAGTWRGTRVIVAVAPTLAGRIDYDPALPAQRDQLTQRVPQGSVIKFEAVYPTPFWRAAGLNGYTNSDRPPVRFTYDNSPPSGRPGVLLGFVAATTPGGSGRMRADGAPARGAGRVHAPVRAGRPLGRATLIEHNWSDELWTRGCYAGFMPPGVWSDYGAGAAGSRRPRSTGPAPRPPRCSWATWTVPCAPASGPPARSASSL